MHDPVDIRRRIERLIERVNGRDDYGQLLASGQVVHSPDSAISRRARRSIRAWYARVQFGQRRPSWSGHHPGTRNAQLLRRRFHLSHRLELIFNAEHTLAVLY